MKGVKLAPPALCLRCSCEVMLVCVVLESWQLKSFGINTGPDGLSALVVCPAQTVHTHCVRWSVRLKEPQCCCLGLGPKTPCAEALGVTEERQVGADHTSQVETGRPLGHDTDLLFL